MSDDTLDASRGGLAMHHRKTPWILAPLALLWLIAIGIGWVRLLNYNYEARPREFGPVPARWPAGSKLQHDRNRATLVLFAHPHCPCTRASIGELALLMAHCQGRVRGHVLLFRPIGSSDEWARTDLWRSAAAIPGVTVACDEGGNEAQLFHVAVSGHAVLYDPQGELLFDGGITDSRGHSGDNAGRSAIVALLHDGGADRTETPVFGCSLRDPESPQEGWTASWHN
jgi:hypothetical protein